MTGSDPSGALILATLILGLGGVSRASAAWVLRPTKKSR